MHTIFVIITDGLENASRKYTYDEVKSMIEHEKEKYGWEFLFVAANIDALDTAESYGISRDRAVNYRADAKGTRVLYNAVCSAIQQVRSDKTLTEDWCAPIRQDYEDRS